MNSYQLVKSILEEDELSRDSDNRLLYKVLLSIGATEKNGVLSIDVNDLIYMQPISTHIRSRRFVQQHHKDLKPSWGVQFKRAERMGQKGLHILDDLITEVKLSALNTKSRGNKILGNMLDTLKGFFK